MDLNDCVKRSLSLLPDRILTGFAANPLRVMREDLGLTVTAAEHLAASRADGGACDGLSFLQDGVILYASTPRSRRENFTLAHELGHWLIDQAPDLYDWLADQQDPGRLLETVCDRIAQQLLLPDSAAVAVVGGGPLRARHITALYEQTQASRPVCAIALAKHLPGLGAIAIIDRRSGTVTHASVKPDPQQGWPTVFPWRGQQLTDSHPLMALAPGASTARRLQWRTSWGREAEFYVDAVGEERRVLAVFCDCDLWGVERFHAPLRRDFDSRPVLTGTCCGGTFERRGYPCSECGQPFCPRCGECRCERAAKRAVRCTHCFLEFQPHLVVDGLCVECRS